MRMAERSSGRIEILPALTGLRAVAALLVLGSHAPLFIGVQQWGPFNQGALGVDIFFILSGFIIGYVHFGDFCVLATSRYVTFLGLRLSRIYPVHAFTLAICVAFASVRAVLGVGNEHNLRYTGGSLIANVLLVQAWGWFEYPTWNTVAWSISAEWLAYLAFPGIARILHNVSKRVVQVALSVLIVSFLVFMYFAEKYQLPTNASWAGPRVIITFSAGVCIYCLWRNHAMFFARKRWLADGAAIVLVLGVWCDSYLLTVVPAFVIVPALASGRGLITRILQAPIFIHLGLISYSLYMLHYLVMEIMFAPIYYTRLFNAGIELRFVVLPFSLIAAFVAAELCYRHVEVPSRGFLRRALSAALERR